MFQSHALRPKRFGAEIGLDARMVAPGSHLDFFRVHLLGHGPAESGTDERGETHGDTLSEALGERQAAAPATQ